jgi:uncharacterized protein YoxC
LNNARRKKLKAISEIMSEQRALLDLILWEEEETISCTPENLQETKRYMRAETYAEAMQIAVYRLDEVITIIEGVAKNVTTITDSKHESARTTAVQ